jgi:hypothetical protein
MPNRARSFLFVTPLLVVAGCQVVSGLSGVDLDGKGSTSAGGGASSTGRGGAGGTGTNVGTNVGTNGSGAQGGGGSMSNGPASGVGGAGGAPIDDAHPPPRPANQPGDGGASGSVFAISKLFLGDTDRDGAKNAVGWEQYGYDVDGQVTTCTGSSCTPTDHCKIASGAMASQTLPDGTKGIDNSFGKSILPILLGAQSTYSTNVNGQLGVGNWSLLFQLTKLGSSTNYSPIVAHVYAGGPLAAPPPKYNGNDLWPFDTSSSVDFVDSYVTADTWVSGKGNLTLPIQSTPDASTSTLKLQIHEAVVSFVLAGGHGSAGGGIISGALKVTEFSAELRRSLGANDVALCQGATINQIEKQVQQAADVMADGTAGTSNVPCDGISIGLGFEAQLVELGTNFMPDALVPCPL